MRMTANAEATELKAKLFQGFADPSRLTILETLSDAERTVGEVVRATGLSQSNISNHLSCLKECGLAVSRRDGRHVYYKLSDPRVSQLLMLANELLADVARGVYECTRYAVAVED
jgi:DNA-binding transcriptional ArsR family regulator